MPIESNIRKLIAKNGLIKIDDLMREALSASPSAYYRNKIPTGESGDFVTAPEISQLFGEVIGLWAIEKWEKLGRPKKISLVELGPGRGYLMRDLLKVAELEPDFFKAAEISLVEINENLIAEQKKNLKNSGKKIQFLDHIFKFKSKSPTVFLANEFFDALPIKQYTKHKELWYEAILIEDPSDGKIKYDKIGVNNKKLAEQFKIDHPEASDGAFLEESLESLETMRFIADFIKKFGGRALIIDYGYYAPPAFRKRSEYISTLQAVKNHSYAPALENIGESDLSAHVDFYSLEKTCRESGVEPEKLTTQRDFLLKYGISLRLESLSKILPKNEAETLSKQAARLISPSGMGTLFKVLSI